MGISSAYFVLMLAVMFNFLIEMELCYA